MFLVDDEVTSVVWFQKLFDSEEEKKAEEKGQSNRDAGSRNCSLADLTRHSLIKVDRLKSLSHVGEHHDYFLTRD